MIPQYFIDDIISATDITAIIKARISLKKQGSSYVALCPFHNEKTPSFNVIPAKRFYYCHGCGASGNAIGFLMQYDHMEFVEAVKHLAADLGLEVPEEKGEKKASFKEDFAILKQLSQHYQNCLRKSSQAINYLKSRGLNGIIAKQFELGFAPDQWDSALKQFGKDDAALTSLKRNGIVVEKDDKRCYDRFRNRIMFPIRNSRGDTIAFGGRTMGEDIPKYMNSPETPLFHKSSELYGLYEALKQSHSPQSILLVEGYMDVIALHQYGIHSVVATLGTATNPKHLQTLFRHTKEVIFCFDGDNAGRAAAWRALITNLGSIHDGVQIRFLFLPEKEDPDTLIRRIGQQGFLQRLQQAQPLSEAFFDLLQENTPLKSADEKAAFASKAQSYLNRIPNGIFKELMKKELAKRLNVYVSDLDSIKGSSKNKISLKKNNALLDPAQKAIALLLQEPKLCCESIPVNELQAIESDNVKLLLDVIELIQKNPDISIGEIISNFDNQQLQQQIAMLAARQLPFAAEGLLAEFNGAIAALQKRYREHTIEQLIEKSRQTELSEEDKRKLSWLLTENHDERV